MKKITAILLALMMLLPLSVNALDLGEKESQTTYKETEIYPGVTHTHIATDSSSVYSTQNFNAIEFDPSDKNLYIDVTGGGDYANKLSKTSDTMAVFAENNPDKTPVAAINGDLWMVAYAHARIEGKGTSYGGYSDAVVKKELTLPRGFNMYNGEIITSDYMVQETPYEGQFWSFGVTADNQVAIGCPKLEITLDDTKADGLNRLPANNALVVYTDKGTLNTHALDDALELLVKTDGYTVKHKSVIKGEIIGIYDESSEENPSMAEDHIILCARGTAIDKVKGYKLGDSVTLSFEVSEKFGRNTELWQNVTNCVGGHMPFVVDGVKNESGVTTGYPTTIVGIKNNGNVVFLVNDGRQSGFSQGLNYNRYWDVTDELDLNTAFILDGGGSATMVLADEGEYKVVNRPCDSGNVERTVVNSVILSVGKAHKTVKNKPDIPSEYIEFGAVHYAASDVRCLVPDVSQLEADTVEEGINFKVKDLYGDPCAIFSFGLPNTRVDNENSAVSRNYPYIDLDEYNYAVVDMKLEHSDASPYMFQAVYATTGKQTGVDQNAFVGFINAVNDGQYHTYIIDLRAFSGKLNTLRFNFMSLNDTKVAEGDEITVHSIRFARDEAEAQSLSQKSHYKAYKIDFYDQNNQFLCSKQVVGGRKYLSFPDTDAEGYIIEGWCFDDGASVVEGDVVNLYEDTVLYFKAKTPFADVSTGEWYTHPVVKAADKGYFKGDEKGNFLPNQALTREQFVLVLARMANADLSEYEGKTSFSDVKAGQWYSAAIAWASEEGYVKGTGNGKFGLGVEISREQLAQLFYNYSLKNGIDTEMKTDLSEYYDNNSISDWARDAMSWSVAFGLINGTSKTTVSPLMTATRSQAAKICVSFSEYM
ncbi:MAG: S-layer homology domain-containing protein [Clostridia bacterium]|nr:S-layer homology domain-containing protein [Clostridia bacterium]